MLCLAAPLHVLQQLVQEHVQEQRNAALVLGNTGALFRYLALSNRRSACLHMSFWNFIPRT